MMQLVEELLPPPHHRTAAAVAVARYFLASRVRKPKAHYIQNSTTINIDIYSYRYHLG